MTKWSFCDIIYSPYTVLYTAARAALQNNWGRMNVVLKQKHLLIILGRQVA
jgi:hypothetical protein